MEQTTPRPQSFTGTVVKTAMQDTATVRVDRYVKHPKYKKYYTRSKNYLVHNPENAAKVGDAVTIVSVKPISKMKRFAIDASKTVSAASEQE